MGEDLEAAAMSPRLDEIIVRRWLIALAFASTVEDLAARVSPMTAGVALVSADTAAEAILGILADKSGEVSKKTDSHERLIELAIATTTAARAPLEPSLVRAIRLTHQRRNGIVHQGGDADPRAVEEARIVVRGLLEALSAALPGLTLFPAGSGPLRAVSSLIDAPELVERMIGAEEKLAAGDLEGAREDASFALGMTLYRIDPPLEHRGPTFPYRGDRRNDRDVALGNTLAAADRRTRVLRNWVVPMALGVSPADYERLSGILGESVQSIDGRDYLMRPPATPLAEPDLRWALPQLARIVFRLWEARSLREGPLETDE